MNGTSVAAWRNLNITTLNKIGISMHAGATNAAKIERRSDGVTA